MTVVRGGLTEAQQAEAERLFWSEGLTLGETASELGLDSIYRLSPWLYAPEMRAKYADHIPAESEENER